MEEVDKRSSTSSNDYFVKSGNKTEVQNYDSISPKLEVINKAEVKKLQLLTLDGWENYQKDLIRLCFEFWEVNETQSQINSISSDLNINNLEIQMPSSLFAEKTNNSESHASKATLDHIINSKTLPIKENNQIIKRKQKESPVFQQKLKVINNNTDRKTNESCSDIIDIRKNKRSQEKKLKTFSLYKQMSKVKPSKTFQSFTFDRSASCSLEDLWKYKNWLDSVEKIKKHEPIKDITIDNSDKINYHGKDDNNTPLENVLDVEAKQMEQKVRKLIKSLKEKDKLFPGIGRVNDQITKSGSSNKFKYFFKNVFRGNQNEIDLHLLDEYTKYAKQKLLTWQTLLNCLEDIRQRESGQSKVTNISEDNIKYKFSEKKEHNDKKISEEFDENNYKFIVIDNGSPETRNKKKKKFFKLRSKTKNSMDMRTATVKRIERKNMGNIVMNDGYLHWTSNKFDGNTNSKFLLGWNAENRIASYQFRRSLSDTDLMTMASANFDERSRRCTTLTRFGWKTLNSETTNGKNHPYHGENVAYVDLWEERQECFQTAVARLEYVGSTLKDQCRLAGLKTLCKVDVLAGFGHSAEAVDLFLSTLPMSKNPELMIRKAEAAYDWKFFCHLSMWRHSYKEL